MNQSPKHIVVAAAVVLNEDNDILLLNGPKRGWEIPGGRVEEGESISSAVIRETKEETGIDIEILRFCGIFQNVKESVISNIFLARAIGGEFRTSSESYELGYFNIDEALIKVNWDSIKEQIVHCLSQKDSYLIEFNH
ncbi:hypothetical protein PAECIP111892_00275 [Paenibacillus auburnensis]|uniref:Nudix hydrolase domain-containing protein n=1 Tax=Paenibacillus auburnensis TaxID=2905649 RepID=A0ABM9BN35_9BACL|nr:NUDIX hydrolase [Paenibacillus auburnensis]CAH1190636.1 hypothetical protein PAECIP111892_00275 [Paenibacillus auburnensis]